MERSSVSEADRDYDQPAADFAPLEAMLRSAGGYVHPTDDLRPNTLEAVGNARKQRMSRRRAGSLAVFSLLLAATGFPDFLLNSRLGPAFVESSELYRRSAELISFGGSGADWALCEVFSELRREQVDMLGHPE